MKGEFSAVEPLAKSHDLSAFNSGRPALDEWLRRFALSNQSSESARTYVVHREKRVVGFFTLCAGSCDRDAVPARVARGLADHPVPVVLLARLAVDLAAQGQGLGQALLRDAMARALAGANVIGARALMVHALDSTAADFYVHFGFAPSPGDALQLFVLMKDLRASLP